MGQRHTAEMITLGKVKRAQIDCPVGPQSRHNCSAFGYYGLKGRVMLAQGNALGDRSDIDILFLIPTKP